MYMPNWEGITWKKECVMSKCAVSGSGMDPPKHTIGQPRPPVVVTNPHTVLVLYGAYAVRLVKKGI
jgi:hypothetical protein